MLDYYGSLSIGLLQAEDVVERLRISKLRTPKSVVSEMGITAVARQHQGGLCADIDKEVG